MINIGTNIFNKLSPASRAVIENEARTVFNDGSPVRFSEYLQNNLGVDQKVKFYFGGIPLANLVSEVSLYDKFIKLLVRAFDLAKKDLAENIEINYWIVSGVKPIMTNVFFSAKSPSDVLDRLLLLKDTLTTAKTFSEENIKVGEILIIGYNEEENGWKINSI